MGGYESGHGPSTGARWWRVRSDPGEIRVLPDGAMDLMWFGGRVVLAGPDTTAMVVTSEQPATTWGLRLAPGVAYALLGTPARELRDQRVELTDLVDVPAEAVDAAHTDPIGALERMLLGLRAARATVPSTPGLAASLDRAARAGTPVHRVADEHGLSERALRRVSDRLFGYGPKTLASIHRFQRALALARSGTPLGEVAATTGYADQSHLSRDVRRLAGTTPGDLLGP